MDAQGQLRHVAIANVLPYQSDARDALPNRVWDLPVELQSEEGDTAAAGATADVAMSDRGGEDSSVRRQRAAPWGGAPVGRGDGNLEREWSPGWTSQLEDTESSGSV